MIDRPTTTSEEAIETVLAAARRMGVELDAEEARQWMDAVSREASGSLQQLTK